MNDGRLVFSVGELGKQQPGGREFYARFARAGRPVMADGSLSDMMLPAEVLRGAVEAGRFEGLAVFLDHSEYSAPSLRDLVGVTSGAVWNEIDQSVEGRIKFYETPSAWGATAIVNQVLVDGSPDVGLSMVFYASWRYQDDMREIASIIKIESVDLVFQPAADGRVLQALSSFYVQKESVMSEERVLEVTGQPDAALSAAAPWVAALADSVGKQIIATSGLPAASVERLQARSYATPEAVSEAIQAERDYLARLQAAQVIQLPGTPPRGQVSGVVTGYERLTQALDALMLGQQPPSGVQPLTGIRELYLHLSGDYEMTGRFQPERVQFANVTSSTMAGLVANAMNKVVINEFQQYPRWWEPFTIQQDFSSLQAVRWITVGGVGELPTVVEGAAYTELTWSDQTETASFTKKGGYLGVTLEAIDKDDTGRVLAAPRALAQAAWLTVGKAVSAIFTSNSGVGPTMSDSVALFHSNHSNLGTSALSMSTWNTARLTMRKHADLNSGERLGALCSPKFLLVPPDLENTAIQILASELDYTYALSNAPVGPVNPNAAAGDVAARLSTARARVIVVDLWTDTNDWAAVADPKLYPTIGLGFRYGRTPEVYSVAAPNLGMMFTNDTMPIKVRFVFATGPVDHRGLYKANV